jgi:hypothetical protein
MGKTLTINEFINKANSIHNNRYDYSNVEYTHNTIPIKIICPEHGEFEQKPTNHLTGYGCQQCGGTKKLDTLKFIDKANQIHNNKYDYSNVNYINARTKITIICPEHGLFEQKSNDHISKKQGCPKCKLNKIGWSYKVWGEAANNSLHFDSFKLYIIECWNDTEKFYKIGKTFKTINERFDTKHRMPYNWKLIDIIEDLPNEISLLEDKLHSQNKEYQYKPKIKFDGMNECFSKIKAYNLNHNQTCNSQ